MADHGMLGAMGEERFSEYLKSRNLTFQRELAAGSSHPDFWVDHDGGQVVCEVKSLEARLSPNTSGSIDVYGPLRKAIKRAGAQGSSVKDVHPYVLVIFAPGWPTDEIAVAGAMFGNVGITFPVGPEIVDGFDRSTTAFLGGGRLQATRNTRFSAVVIVERLNPGQLLLDRSIAGQLEGMTLEEAIGRVTSVADELEAKDLLSDDERVPRVDVYINPFAAVPLPENLFVGPFDRMYSIDESGAFALRMMGVELEGFYS